MYFWKWKNNKKIKNPMKFQRIKVMYFKHHQQFKKVICWRVHFLQKLSLKIKGSMKRKRLIKGIFSWICHSRWVQGYEKQDIFVSSAHKNGQRIGASLHGHNFPSTLQNPRPSILRSMWPRVNFYVAESWGQDSSKGEGKFIWRGRECCVPRPNGK